MTDLLFVYIPCTSSDEAKKIGDTLLSKKICPCYNILNSMHSCTLWPPKTGKIEEVDGAVLIAKTIESKYGELEAAVVKLHSDSVPCIVAFPAAHVYQPYMNWFRSELEANS